LAIKWKKQGIKNVWVVYWGLSGLKGAGFQFIPSTD
jgi:hypothetical protein